MKSTIYAAVIALAANKVAGHATWQQLWVEGVDFGTQCARVPLSNSPVTDVTSTDMACNAGTSAVSSTCPVTAGSSVTVEMHQQPNDRSCSNEAIGGAHYGPVIVYMAKVSDATSAVGSDAAWFKVFEDTWSSAGSSGSSDNWGTKDLNTCCGKMDVLIPADVAPGDYLLRAEAIALHSAGGSGGAQMYMTCYQITVSGSGSASPDTVSLPGAYAASDPGILINIYQSMTTYVAPGPTVYSGGSSKTAGAACTNCESTCAAGSGASGTAVAGGGSETLAATSAKPTTLASTSTPAAVTSTPAATSTPEVSAKSTSQTAATAATTLATATSSSLSASSAPASTGAPCKRSRKRRLARHHQ